MEVNNNNSLFTNPNTTATANANSDKTKEAQTVTQSKTKIEQTPEGPVRKTYDYVFKNADDKFLDSFSKMTSNLPIMEASFMKTKVEVNLINYHKEQITTEIKSKLGKDFELTEDMKQKIFNEAMQRAETQGFSNINMNNFLGYVNQNIQSNPLLQSSPDSSFFSGLQSMYNSQSINSLG